MEFGDNMNVVDSKVDLKGQGQRSRSPGQKTGFQVSFYSPTGSVVIVKGHRGQGH